MTSSATLVRTDKQPAKLPRLPLTATDRERPCLAYWEMPGAPSGRVRIAAEALALLDAGKPWWDSDREKVERSARSLWSIPSSLVMSFCESNFINLESVEREGEATTWSAGWAETRQFPVTLQPTALQALGELARQSPDGWEVHVPGAWETAMPSVTEEGCIRGAVGRGHRLAPGRG